MVERDSPMDIIVINRKVCRIRSFEINIYIQSYLNFLCLFMTMIYSFMPFKPYHAKLIYLNFRPLKVVSRYLDLQLQVAENHSHICLI